MKEQLQVTLKLHVEVSTKKIVKIKAHKRIINGKTVKVRSHYRVIEGQPGSGIGLTASWRCLLPLGVYSRDNASWCYLCLYLGTILSNSSLFLSLFADIKVVIPRLVRVRMLMFITLLYNRDSKDFDITSRAFDDTLSAWN